MTAMRIHHRIETLSEAPLSDGDAPVEQPGDRVGGDRRAGSIGMYVMFVTIDVRTEEKPRMMNSVARVTMNDGSPVRTTMMPLSTPRQRRRGHRHEDRQPDRQAPDRHADADDDAGEADQRADREVELAGDHQQGDRGADDPDLGRDVEVVERPGRGDEREVALREADDREHQPDEDDDDQRPGGGPRQDPLGEREPSEPFGSGCRLRLGRRGRHHLLRSVSGGTDDDAGPSHAPGRRRASARSAQALRRKGDDVRGVRPGSRTRDRS